MDETDTNVPNKTEYISREAAIKEFCDDCMDREWCKSNGESCSRIKNINAVPAADVRPVTEISDAVDEVLDFLNANSNQMPYHIYSALFDLVSGICHNSGADKNGGRGWLTNRHP